MESNLTTIQTDTGFFAHCNAYVTENNWNLIYLSFFGYKTSNRAIWAALMGNRGIQIDRRYYARQRNMDYKAYNRKFESLAEHMVIIGERALYQYAKPKEPFYLLSPNPEPDLRHFGAFLNKLSSIPLLPSWDSYLWEKGKREGLIEELQSQGINAWKADTNDNFWIEIILDGLRERKICA